MKRIVKMPHKVIHGKNTDDGGYILPRLSICPGTLMIVTANAILIGNHFLQSLK
jgi:hypothetical protein